MKINERKNGYKNSKLGWIPEDWKITQLKDLVDIQSGESPSNYDIKNKGKYPFIKVEDMNNCVKYQKLSRFYIKEKKLIIPKNSIIFPKRGAAILNNKVRIASVAIYMDSNMMALLPKKHLIDVEYLYYTISNEKLYKIADTSTIPQINNKHINPYKIRLPFLNEQKKIAKILSAWDDTIATIEKLIAAKEKLKKGLMQQLLMGKKRFKEFEGNGKYKKTKLGWIPEDWEIVKLGDIFSLGSGNIKPNDSQKEKNNIKKYPVYGGNGITAYSSEYFLDKEVILIGRVGEYCGCIHYINNKCWITDNALYVREWKTKTSVIFFKYLLEQQKLSRLRNKGGQPLISQKPIYNLKIPLPPFPEQQKIASILSDFDLEIRTLNEKLNALQSQKKGLMQQLLTGKVRVKIDS